MGYYLVDFEGINPTMKKYDKWKDLDLKKCALISSFLIHPHLRGNSLQLKLTQIAEEEAESRGFSNIMVSVRNDNKFANVNFLKVGFKLFAESKELGFYDEMGFYKKSL